MKGMYGVDLRLWAEIEKKIKKKLEKNGSKKRVVSKWRPSITRHFVTSNSESIYCCGVLLDQSSMDNALQESLQDEAIESDSSWEVRSEVSEGDLSFESDSDTEESE